MIHTTRIAIATLAVSTLLVGSNVLAEPVDDSILSKPKLASEQPKKCDRWEGKEKRLEALKADLKLNASQEAAWTEWAGKLKGDRQGWEERRKNVESLASLPAPERMEKMLAFSKEHVAKQEAQCS